MRYRVSEEAPGTARCLLMGLTFCSQADEALMRVMVGFDETDVTCPGVLSLACICPGCS